MDDAYAKFLEAAVWAPSGDNTQPCQFAVDEDAKSICVRVDETRDTSPMNSGQRMARIAVGAAIENIIRTAAGNDWQVEFDESPASPFLARMRITQKGKNPVEIDDVIRKRVTNRRRYDGRMLSSDLIEALAAATPAFDGVKTHWIVERERIETIARLVGRADALMFGEPTMRRAFLSKVRFDAPKDEEVEEGLSLGSLELGKMDRFALRMMPYMPNWFVWLSRATKIMGAKSRRLVLSASGLCLVVAPNALAKTDIAVGRVMQRAWLELTRVKMSAQPMMSLLVLENVVENGTEQVIDRIGRKRLDRLRDDFRAAAVNIGKDRPAYLMRFGYADPPSTRCGRLPTNEFVCGSLS